MTALKGSHSVWFTDWGSRSWCFPLTSLSRNGGDPQNSVAFCHNLMETGPYYLWTDTVVCVVGASSWLLRAPRSIRVGGGKPTGSVPGGFEVEDPSSDSQRASDAHLNPFLRPGFLQHKGAI